MGGGHFGFRPRLLYDVFFGIAVGCCGGVSAKNRARNLMGQAGPDVGGDLLRSRKGNSKLNPKRIYTKPPRVQFKTTFCMKKVVLN